MINIHGFYKEKKGELSPENVMVVLDIDKDLGYAVKYTVFSPYEGHTQASIGYIMEVCEPITCEEFRKASKGFYVPWEYVNDYKIVPFDEDVTKRFEIKVEERSERINKLYEDLQKQLKLNDDDEEEFDPIYPSHYHFGNIDVIEFCEENIPKEQLIGFFRVNVIKYIARYDKKNGIEDLKKAMDYLERLIELEGE